MAGILYLVATPIGNLGDFSPRAAETLAQADFIAAEDTRVSVKLLNHFDIKKPLVSYHEHNRAAAGQAILERLLSGETCALVTDAGTPAISDPGQELVALCAENGVTVQAIPGCCAAIAALAVSGLDTRRFTFEGFLPSGKKERRAALEELTGEVRTMVFHEAPHRLRQTLADMAELLGDRPVALCRELTKLHEDTVRTTLAQAAAFYRDNEPRGEYVLVIAGREKQNLPALTLEEGAARVLALRDGGMKLKEAVRRVADDTGLPRNALNDTALKAYDETNSAAPVGGTVFSCFQVFCSSRLHLAQIFLPRNADISLLPSQNTQPTWARRSTMPSPSTLISIVSRSPISSARRISIGTTIRPSSSTRRTIPVDFMSSPPLCSNNKIPANFIPVF